MVTKRFEGTCCLHLQCRIVTHLFTKLHGISYQETATFKTWEVSWPAKQLSVLEEGLCYMELRKMYVADVVSKRSITRLRPAGCIILSRQHSRCFTAVQSVTNELQFQPQGRAPEVVRSTGCGTPQVTVTVTNGPTCSAITRLVTVLGTSCRKSRLQIVWWIPVRSATVAPDHMIHNSKQVRFITTCPYKEICRCGGIAPPILTPTPDGGEWSVSGPDRFTTLSVATQWIQRRYMKCELVSVWKEPTPSGILASPHCNSSSSSSNNSRSPCW
jgi:hypothetical protein